MVITRRVPSAVGPPLPWPEIATYRADLWQPKPVGVGEDDQAMTMQLPERNFLLGGEPGAGKSIALSLLVATAALDPNYKLATWNRYAEGSAGVCVSEAIEVLHSLREEMDRRYTQLLHHGKRKVAQDDRLPLHLIVIDELAHYLTLTASDRKERTEFAVFLHDLMSRGPQGSLWWQLPKSLRPTSYRR